MFSAVTEVAAERQTTAGWSKKAFISQLTGFNDPSQLDQYVTASSTVHTRDNRVGGIYSFNYDVLHAYMQSQRRRMGPLHRETSARSNTRPLIA